MDQTLYHKLCVANIVNGVTEGLTQFSHPSRVALILLRASMTLSRCWTPRTCSGDTG